MSEHPLDHIKSLDPSVLPSAFDWGEQTMEPADLAGEAQRELKRISNELSAANRLEACDRAILETYSRVWATHRLAAAHVERWGPVIRWHNDVPGPNPYYKIAKETSGILRQLLAELGMTPAARQRVKAKAAEPDPKDDEFGL